MHPWLVGFTVFSSFHTDERELPSSQYKIPITQFGCDEQAYWVYVMYARSFLRAVLQYSCLLSSYQDDPRQNAHELQPFVKSHPARHSVYKNIYIFQLKSLVVVLSILTLHYNMLY